LIISTLPALGAREPGILSGETTGAREELPMIKEMAIPGRTAGRR
jgi:hypothetical protein